MVSGSRLTSTMEEVRSCTSIQELMMIQTVEVEDLEEVRGSEPP